MNDNQLVCAECGEPIVEEYYQCLDNFIQVKYFDSEKENIFCSQECFCKYVQLELQEVSDNE